MLFTLLAEVIQMKPGKISFSKKAREVMESMGKRGYLVAGAIGSG